MRSETIDRVTRSPLACLPLLLFCFERRRGVQRQTSNFTLLTITSLNSIAAEESERGDGGKLKQLEVLMR